MMQEETFRAHDYLFKAILVGSPNVGKSALMASFMGHEQADEYHSTIGVEFQTKRIDTNKKSVALQIWDTAGSDNLPKIARAYARGASAKFFCFDPFNRASFDAIPKWFTMMNIAAPEADIYLVATHSDIEGTPEVTQEEMEALGRDILNENGTFRGVYHVSAKTGQKIDELFTDAAKNSYMKSKTEKAMSAAASVQPSTQTPGRAVLISYSPTSGKAALISYLQWQIERPELKGTEKLKKFQKLLENANSSTAETTQLLKETRQVAGQHQPTNNLLVMAYNAFTLPTSLKQLNEIFPPAPASTPTPH